MKKIWVILSGFIIATANMLAQSNEKFDQFQSIVELYGAKSDTATAFLTKWEKEEPTNAGMLCCWSLLHNLISKDFIEEAEITRDFSELENPAMLTDTISRFGELQIHPFRNMKDKGNGMEHYLKAQEYMQKAISLHPNILELYTYKTAGFFDKNEFKYAASTLMDVIELDHQEPNRWTDFYGNNIGDSHDEMMNNYLQTTFGVLVGNMEFSLAEFICDTLISLYPKEISYKFDKGIIYHESGQQDKALNYFLQLHEEDPDDGNVQNVLAAIYKEKNDTVNVKKYATMLLQNPNKKWASAGQQFLSEYEQFKIDFQAIKEWYENNTAEFHALETRFKSGDTSLSLNDLARIYFAHALTEKCKSTQLWPVSLDSLLNANNFKECYEESKKCIEQHPASLAALTYIVIAGQKIQATDIENAYIRLTMLANMIQQGASTWTKQVQKVSNKTQQVTSNYKEDQKIFNILWREDENVFVDYFMSEEERKKTSLFSNPGYFF